MKTKAQKNQVLEEVSEKLKDTNNLVFVDFTGTSVEDMKELRRSLKAVDAKMEVVKKKLMRVALEKKGIDFNPEQYEAQMATIFTASELSDVASPVYKFFKDKEKKGFKVLGAYNLSENRAYDAEMVKTIGQLPSKDVLLGQFAGMLLSPLRMFMYIVDQKSKQETAA